MEINLLDYIAPYIICDQVTLIVPALRTIGNFATGSDYCVDKIINLGVIPKIIELCEHSKATLRKEACWMMSNVAAGSPE